MCDLKAYLRKDGKDELVLEAVSFVGVNDKTVTIRNIFGKLMMCVPELPK